MSRFGRRMLRYAAGSKRRRRLAGPVIRAASPILPLRQPPREPIFVVGSPRSGTTLLFELLDRCSALASLQGESHLLWELYHPSGSAGWTSHLVPPEAVSDRERRAVYWMIAEIAGRKRYLDKSPRNSLRVPYLHAMFPGAWFVFLKRDGRAAVSSLITGWRSNDPRFPGTSMPRPLSIEGYAGSNWRFLVPPGWEGYAAGRSLPEVCAFQWVSANEAILAGRDEIASDRWLEVRYEELVASPRDTSRALLSRLGLPLDEGVLSASEGFDRRVTRAVTPPRANKWREENPAEIEAILPMIAPMMERLRYPTDAAAGSD